MQDFRQLGVWQKAHRLVLDLYRATRLFPKEELYGLTSQIRRCSASVPANVAEGCGRGSDPDFARFLQLAMGSASELEYHLLLAHDLGYLKDTDAQRLTEATIEVKRMLTSLIRRLQGKR